MKYSSQDTKIMVSPLHRLDIHNLNYLIQWTPKLPSWGRSTAELSSAFSVWRPGNHLLHSWHFLPCGECPCSLISPVSHCSLTHSQRMIWSKALMSLEWRAVCVYCTLPFLLGMSSLQAGGINSAKLLPVWSSLVQGTGKTFPRPVCSDLRLNLPTQWKTHH